MELTIKEMTHIEAKELVRKINSVTSDYLVDIRPLLIELDERRGWEALGYKSLRECMTKEFKQSQRYLYYQLEAAKTEKNICTRVQITESIPEKHLRPLTSLEPDEQAEAWKEAVATAPEGKVTAEHVKRTVQEIKEIKDQINRTEKHLKLSPPSNGMQFARMAILDLEKITDDDSERDEALALVEEWIKQHKGRK
jgi:hypothetical protein